MPPSTLVSIAKKHFGVIEFYVRWRTSNFIALCTNAVNCDIEPSPKVPKNLAPQGWTHKNTILFFVCLRVNLCLNLMT